MLNNDDFESGMQSVLEHMINAARVALNEMMSNRTDEEVQQQHDYMKSIFKKMPPSEISSNIKLFEVSVEKSMLLGLTSLYDEGNFILQALRDQQHTNKLVSMN